MNGGVAGLSGSLALVLLLPMEAGVPIPVPADLVMFTVGERVAAGEFPLWLAVAGFEVIAVLGTTALFLACRGPAQRIIARIGPRFGFTEARLRRAAVFAETRGRPGLALGRATPGLRRLTVIAAAVSGLNGRRALPALILGSSVFLQLHLVLGMLFGPLADRAFDRAQGPALVAAAVLVIGTVVFWRVRRRRRATAPGAWTEATCPACIGVSLLAGRVPGVAGLAATNEDRPRANVGSYGTGGVLNRIAASSMATRTTSSRAEQPRSNDDSHRRSRVRRHGSLESEN